MQQNYEYEEAGAWRTARRFAIVAGLAGAAFFGYAHVTSAGATGTGITSASAPVTTIVTTALPTTAPATTPPSTTEASTTEASITDASTTEASTTDASTTEASTTAPAHDASASGPESTGTTESTIGGSAPPAMLPDGSTAPVVAIFDVSTITLAGAVPDRAAADRLIMLAVANSKTAASVIDLLTVDASVPEGVGVRVVELTSSRFPVGSAEILPAHAAELDRMVAVMTALPNVSVLVVGHADQVGSAEANYALSEERAQAVVHYLVDTGIDASRLSSRAVGESDLLSVDDDATSLALNRRTEFIIYGALVGA